MNISLHAFTNEKREMLTANIASRNELLAELFKVPSIATCLLPELRVVSLTVNQVLYELGDQIDYIYFPLDSVVSGLAIMEDGTTVETSMIGREGLVGISTILGSGLSRQWVWATVGGSALLLEKKYLEKIFVQNETALRSLTKLYRSLITQLSQRCVCNTRHTIMERLCCWLLMIHDRVGSDRLNLTQEIIASRVGARRAGITVAAGLLQSMKAIEYRRGQLHITDRETLERTVCECYKLIKGDSEFAPAPHYPAFSL
jgi:CRP-like cAMP-binding protein